MSKNQAFGHWTQQETNWSTVDTDFIQNAIKELNKESPTSYHELVERNEAKLKDINLNKS